MTVARLASFRDPGGRLAVVDGRVFRVINKSAVREFTRVQESSAVQKLVSAGRVVRTEVVAAEDALAVMGDVLGPTFDPADAALILEHARIPFPSFPYEWAPELLYEAGMLTLQLAEDLLEDQLCLKDATPYNVLFRGPHPVFIDILSIEGRDPHDSMWLPYAQFVRTFVLPLLVSRYFRVPLSQVFLTRRDGLEPEEIYRLCGLWRRLASPFLTLVSIPSWLSGKAEKRGSSLYLERRVQDVERVRFTLRALFHHLRRVLRRVRPREGQRSAWSGYMSENQYDAGQFTAKQAFVEEVLRERRPRRVLDVGCNTGFFSLQAAHYGARVVSIDYDPVVVGHVWRKAMAERADVLPLVVDLTRPSPAVGWRNQECRSFLQRARGEFDAVLLLAVVHHMLVSERIPLEEIVSLAAELTNDVAVVEFVDPQDAMFRRLARGRDALFAGLTSYVFEAACRKHFAIVRSRRIDDAADTRRALYFLRKANG